MSTAPALRRIAIDLRASVGEDVIDRDMIELSARRIDMQAEMLEEGLADVNAGAA